MARYRFLELHIQGHEDVNERLRAFPNVMRAKIVSPALRAGARVVQGILRGTAPVRSGRLRGGNWRIRAYSKRHVRGVRVAAPTRSELGIPANATGFYPISLEFGWRVGRQQHGPLNLGAKVFKKSRKGYLYPATEFSVGEARRALNAVRRKIPGRRFMRAALFGSQSQVFAAIASEAYQRFAKLEHLLPKRAADGEAA